MVQFGDVSEEVMVKGNEKPRCKPSLYTENNKYH